MKNNSTAVPVLFFFK